MTGADAAPFLAHESFTVAQRWPQAVIRERRASHGCGGYQIRATSHPLTTRCPMLSIKPTLAAPRASIIGDKRGAPARLVRMAALFIRGSQPAMSGRRSRAKGKRGEREIVRLARAAGLAAERTWHLAQSPSEIGRCCDVLIAGQPYQVKRPGCSCAQMGTSGLQ